MNFKYWEWEAAPYKEKLKVPTVKAITDALFTDETKAYRFACVLNTARQHPVQLKDCDTSVMPKSVWYYYLEMAVRLGMLDKQGRIYVLTNRFTRPFANYAEYYQKWRQTEGAEELKTLYPRAKENQVNKQETATELA